MGIFIVLVGMAYFLYFMNGCKTIDQIMEVLYIGVKGGHYSVLTIIIHFLIYFYVIFQTERLLGAQGKLYYMLRSRVKNNEEFLKMQGIELFKNDILLLVGRVLADCFIMFIFRKNTFCTTYVLMVLFFATMVALISMIGLFMYYYTVKIYLSNILGCCVLVMCFIHILLNGWIKVRFYNVIGFEIAIGIVCVAESIMVLKNRVKEIERV